MKRRRRKNFDKSMRKLSAALCIAAAVMAVGAAAIRVKTEPVGTQPVSSAETHQDRYVSSQEEAPAKKPKYSLPNDAAPKPDNAVPQANASLLDEFADNEDSEQTMAIQTVANPSSYLRAVSGAVTKSYSMNSLVYSRTMGDWRVHQGVDLSATKGESVKSASEGIVTGVQDNALYGTIVTVNQNDGCMVNYCGLNKNVLVKVGDKVSAGTVLGSVGEIPCESGDGIHLHIEVLQQKKYCDPAEKLGYR